jgi:acetyl-CoA carboxylase biotin carboxyl carrier protein
VQAAASGGAAAAAPAPPQPEKAGPPPGSHIINSPIVGTFYRSPSPDASPFVDVGSRVKKGQVLCIIEAMKLMNEIESDVDGEILEIYPQNAQPVEFGEPLFAVRASGS